MREFADMTDQSCRRWDNRLFVDRMTQRAVVLAMALCVSLSACTTVPAPSASPGTGTPASTAPIASLATATLTAGASTCGRLVDYTSSETERVLTLELRSIDQSTRTFRYHLVGPGTMPADVAQQFAAGTPQILSIQGQFTPSTEPTVSGYSVLRIDACPVTR